MNPWQINRAVSCLQTGGVIAYPTESVFGLGCDASNLNAITRLLDIKNRSYKKGLIVLVSDISQALTLLAPLSQSQIESISRPSLRATTWLIEANTHLSPLLIGTHEKLAVRVTSNPTAKAICELFNKPIISTSCNLSGKPTTTSAALIRNKMLLKVDQVISGSCCGQSPSQLIDLKTGRFLRS
jgi:L-threonylcarbamoyladenylate synthase